MIKSLLNRILDDFWKKFFPSSGKRRRCDARLEMPFCIPLLQKASPLQFRNGNCSCYIFSFSSVTLKQE